MFAANGWKDSWCNGVYDFLHFHTKTHEVLGIARGHTRVQFGGRSGRILELRAGDVVILPAGTGHCGKSQSKDLLVVGAYTRRDQAPDIEADMHLIEDAAACIADALGKWKECFDALSAVVQYLRKVPRVFVSSGPKLMSQDEKAKRSALVDNVVDRMAALAKRALTGDASPTEFEGLSRELHEIGVFAENQLASDVARAFYRTGKTV